GDYSLLSAKSAEQDARLLTAPAAELRRLLDEGKRQLFEVRSRRVWPGRDEKVLPSWNGLMIAAFAQAAQVLDRPEYAAPAARAANFILSRMRAPDGRLLRTYSAGSEAKLNGYLEDFAFGGGALGTVYAGTVQRPLRAG